MTDMRGRMMAIALLAAALPFAAQAMTVTDFLGKADALKAKGMMAILSPDASVLKGEMTTVAAAYRADLTAAQKAGKPPHSCPPPPGKSSIAGEDVIAWLRKIPDAAKPHTSVRTAFYSLMQSRYPCR